MGVEYSRFLVPVPSSYAPSSDSIVKLIDAMVSQQWLPTRNSPSLNRVRHTLPDRDAKDRALKRKSPLAWIFPWLARADSKQWVCQIPRYVDSPTLIDAQFINSRVEDGGLKLLFGISNLELDDIKYPLERLDYEKDDTYYDMVFWYSDDFVCVTSDTLEGLESTNCSCGENLSHQKECDVFSPDDHFPLLCPRCGEPFNPNDRKFRVCDGFSGEYSEIDGGTVFRFAIEIDCGKCTPNSSVNFAHEYRELCSNVLECEFQEIESIH